MLCANRSNTLFLEYGRGEVWSAGQSLDGDHSCHRGLTLLKGLPGRVTSVAGRHHHSMCLLEDGSLYGIGYNDLCQIGTLDRVALVPTLVPRVSALRVACGEAHTVIIATDGTLWAWGNNEHGQCGNSPRTVPHPALMNGNVEGAENVVCGASHTMVWNKDVLWACGRNSAGQLGLGHNNDIRSLTDVRVDETIQSVACGAMWSVWLDYQGVVRTAGENQNGQLGHGDTISRHTFTPISASQSKFQARQIACGNHRLFVIDRRDRLWSCGYNQTADLTHCCGRLLRVLFEEAQYVCAGPETFFILDKDDSVWVSGNNNYGQLASPHSYKSWLCTLKKNEGIDLQYFSFLRSSRAKNAASTLPLS